MVFGVVFHAPPETGARGLGLDWSGKGVVNALPGTSHECGADRLEGVRVGATKGGSLHPMPLARSLVRWR